MLAMTTRYRKPVANGQAEEGVVRFEMPAKMAYALGAAILSLVGTIGYTGYLAQKTGSSAAEAVVAKNAAVASSEDEERRSGS